MHKFFVDTSCIEKDIITIQGDDAHHIFRVLRLKEDDEIVVKYVTDERILFSTYQLN